ncbi:MAG: hypothetical protein MHM6MM_002519 [Cercozoa sp. M6MM]
MLLWLGIPTTEQTLTPCGQRIEYAYDNLPLSHEALLAFAGFGMTLVCLALCIAIGLVWQRTVAGGHFPHAASLSIAVFAGCVTLQAILVPVCDCATTNWRGDAFKMFHWFERSEGSGFAGVLLTLLALTAGTMLAVPLCYVYLTKLHMDGRIVDVYRRMHAQDSVFYLPHDFEVSAAYVKREIFHSTAKRSSGDALRVVVRSVTRTRDNGAVEQDHLIALVRESAWGDVVPMRRFIVRSDGSILEAFPDLPEFDIYASLLNDIGASLHGSSNDTKPCDEKERDDFEVAVDILSNKAHGYRDSHSESRSRRSLSSNVSSGAQKTGPLVQTLDLSRL